MQETHDICFGSMKRNTTHGQAKTDKHECRRVTAAYHCVSYQRIGMIVVLVLTYFCLTKCRVTFFRPEAIAASFLHLRCYFAKLIINHASKLQFEMVLRCLISKCVNPSKFLYRKFHSKTILPLS